LGGCLFLLQQIERELNGEFLLLPQALEFVECICNRRGRVAPAAFPA
jgi:hypothetical protein